MDRIVTTLEDNGSDGSLRYQLDASADGDVITFAPGLTGTIHLLRGALSVLSSVTIDGGNSIAIDGHKQSSDFSVGTQYVPNTFDLKPPIIQSPNVTIENMTIENGFEVGQPQLPTASNAGGGIHLYAGQLTLASDTFANNSAEGGYGAGFKAAGQGGNAAGAVYVEDGADVVSASNVTFINNTAVAGQGSSGGAPGAAYDISNDPTVAACYLTGTLIQTVAGDVPIEGLNIGDLVVSAHGGPKPVRWIGRRSYSGAQARGRPLILPICIKAGSLGDGVPRRDLWVSPGHAMLVEDQLVQARLLVNGVSIIQAESVDMVTYLNVELEEHDVILAEGAPAETFYDNGMRCEFANAAEFASLYPDHRAGLPVQPLLEEGFVLDAIRRRIDSRAGIEPALPGLPGELLGFLDVVGPDTVTGWAQDKNNPEEPVRLDVLVDGRRVLRILANRHRADLQTAGIGSGRHAFQVPVAADWHGAITVQRTTDQATLPLSDRAKAASKQAA